MSPRTEMATGRPYRMPWPVCHFFSFQREKGPIDNTDVYPTTPDGQTWVWAILEVISEFSNRLVRFPATRKLKIESAIRNGSRREPPHFFTCVYQLSRSRSRQIKESTRTKYASRQMSLFGMRTAHTWVEVTTHQSSMCVCKVIRAVTSWRWVYVFCTSLFLLLLDPAVGLSKPGPWELVQRASKAMPAFTEYPTMRHRQ